jgi:hypothetical protein
MGYKKVTKSDKFVDMEIYMRGSISLSFSSSPKFKLFKHDFLHVYEINKWLATSKYIFQYLLIHINMTFYFF